ncbi:MAG: cytochrome c oxidase accessory protein CcoG [Phycisphaerales bacterium]|nr:MAG: cytochrome c oxidase accessory protein CcoG [Phycisphaerales bacterium]
MNSSSAAEKGIPVLDEGVLSTLNADGTRRWLRPRLSKGRFLKWRRIVGYCLIVIFVALPHLRINGKPPILLDLPNRQFTFFGATFLPTDTLLLALLFLSFFIGIFLITALFGRIWCGWGCPQTVYMELVYRPIERLFDGRSYRDGGRTPVHPMRRAGKYAVFFVVSLVLAHTFLAYFVSSETLARWMTRSPLEHPTAFIIVAVVTTLMMLDFCLFREQVCTLMCPYGRFQSVLLDRQSLIVSYDEKRGEPRGKRRRGEEAGDCVDCRLCVLTCPTGIDIRGGLQMECINCTQCIDACDSVMDRLNRPRGLIRYSSQEAIEGGRRQLIRPRVVLYPLLLMVVVSLFGLALAGRSPVDVSFLRNRGSVFHVLDSGSVENKVHLKLTNRAPRDRSYNVSVIQEGVAMTCSDLPLRIGPGDSASLVLHVTVPRDRFEGGRAEVKFLVGDDTGYEREFSHQVLGPLFGGDASSTPTSPQEADQ